MKWHIIIQIAEEDKKWIRKLAIDSNKSLAEWIGEVLVNKVKEDNNELIKEQNPYSCGLPARYKTLSLED